MNDKIFVIDAPQRSDLWRQARLGKLTGSCAGDMLAKVKTGEAAARRDLRLQLVIERLTRLPEDDGYINKEMQRGIDCEPLALAAYEASRGLLVRKTGFVGRVDCESGSSLDGDIDKFAGILELKCPKSTTHLRYIRAGGVPADYLPQLRHNVWVTGAQWADFVSFDDRFPPELQLFCVHVTREALEIPAYEALALAFLKEVDQEFAEVSSLMKQAAVA